ncbi:MAG: pyruvate, phosphate dikinase [Deltaproteobacteria bacterium]|nr:pyruvate, phosphate dikinase [Deltaproteobacteria bacterium]
MVTFFKSQKTGDACLPLPDMDPEQVGRYRHFRALLANNRAALTLMADLEQMYYDNRPFTIQFVERKRNQLFSEVDAMVQSLSGVSGKTYERLSGMLEGLRHYSKDELKADIPPTTEALTMPIDGIEEDHDRAVGAKAANLARMRRELALPTPNGFAITTTAYRLFLIETGLAAYIDEALAELSADDPAALEAIGSKIRARIMESPLPATIHAAMEEAAGNLTNGTWSNLRLAVRSSAIGEDSEISFAGQYTSVLNVPVSDLAEAYKQVVASKYSASALSYRLHHGVDDRETPMAVLVLEMIQPRLSGVLYTADSIGTDQDSIRISAVHGLGDALVGGDASPQRTYRIDKNEFRILDMGGIGIADRSPVDASSEAESLRELWDSAKLLENHFQRPLDIEWALDGSNRLFLLQARPLLVIEETADQGPEPAHDYPGHPMVIEGGKCAAGGVVAGRVLILKNTETDDPIPRLDPDTILVACTASTSITPWIGKAKGIITDIGSVASHLASVAREFGVPALFDTQTATATLKDGQQITLWASKARVYRGVVEELTRGMRPVKRPIFASPMHLRLQRLLDLTSPLNLTAPDSPQFTQEGCRTVHDIIRYCHEMSVREMFRFGESTGRLRAAMRLKVSIPIQLYVLDLGHGLRRGLTTCDEINAHDVVSAPFRALWRGLSHPCVNWTSTIAVGAHNFMSLMAGGAMPQQGRLGEASYAIVSADYMNLSARFGYHFATVDALCGTDTEHNYVNLQFAGGAGAYFGRTLRIQYMAAVLKRLGFEASVKGDLIEASMARLDQAGMEEALDQLGRLLGTSRLLDMALNSPEQVVSLADAFFQGKYDILEREREDGPKDFHLITGNWKTGKPDMEQGVLQDGSNFGSWISAGVSQAMARVMGKRYQELLDNIGAYYYFPLAIAKESSMAEGMARVMVKPLSGYIDQAGGLAFAIRDWGNYFVFRINALEDNAILFEFRNGKRIERSNVETPISSGQWHRLRVETADHHIRAFLEDNLLLEYTADRDLDGYVGLWTKADSVTLFNGLFLERGTAQSLLQAQITLKTWNSTKSKEDQ